MAPAPPTEFRIVNRPGDDPEFPMHQKQYVVSRTILSSDTRTYEAWEIADGRTFEFTVTKWVDEATVSHWLGLIEDPAVSRPLILAAFPEAA